MSQYVIPVRRVVRIVAAIGTILALMLAGGAPSDPSIRSTISIRSGR